MNNITYDTAIFAGGCFWCTEAIYQNINGVKSVESGYIGGHVTNPNYKEVCSGETGHAEAVKIIFDPSKVSYETLLDVFWHTHDPTTVNRQGADIGTQYRSAIFFMNNEQEKIAIQSKEKYNSECNGKIVTEINPYTIFYVAETYHQDYLNRNPQNSYCRMVIQPKLTKFQIKYKSLLLTE